MRMLVAGVSDHLSVIIIDEGLGWHFSSWRLRRNAAAPDELSAVARARLFSNADAALSYFRQFSGATPPHVKDSAPVAQDAVAGDGLPPLAPAGRRDCRQGLTNDHGVFAWVPEAAIRQALASSWNLGLAIGAIQGHSAGFRMQLTNGGVVYVLNGQPSSA